MHRITTPGGQRIQVEQALVPIGHTDSDDILIDLWLHGRPATTQRAYRWDIRRFMDAVGKPLREITLKDLQVFADSLDHYAPATRARSLNAIKSLFTFGQSSGYLVLNVAAAIRAPKRKNTLGERIMSEEQVQQILVKESDRRSHLLIRLLYASGGRISEVCSLRWRDAQPRGDAGQVVLFGKGGKTRVVLLSKGTWVELVSARLSLDPDAPIFAGRKGGQLSPTQAWRLVKVAAERAGLPDVSPHWFRHAHASHALDRGASIALVQQTLGHADTSTTGLYLHARPDDSSAKYLGV